MGIKLFILNKQLNRLLRNKNDLLSQVVNLDNEKKEIKKFHERIELNYKLIQGLNTEPNIEIIHNLEELNLLTNFIWENSTISYYICYKATVNGDSGEKFRDLCNGLSPLAFLIETEDGFRFGGYTSKPFFRNNGNGYREDNEAFIFSFDTKKKYKIEKTEYSIYDDKNNFPGFGNSDIFIGKDFLNSRSSVCLFPMAYEKDPNSPRDYLLTGGVKKFKIKELEVLSVFVYNNL